MGGLAAIRRAVFAYPGVKGSESGSRCCRVAVSGGWDELERYGGACQLANLPTCRLFGLLGSWFSDCWEVGKLAECGGFLVYPKGKRGRGGERRGGAEGAGPDGEASAGVDTRAGSRKRGRQAGLVVYRRGKPVNARARVSARYRGAGARAGRGSPANAGRTKKVCSYRDGGPARRGGETTGAGWVRRAAGRGAGPARGLGFSPAGVAGGG